VLQGLAGGRRLGSVEADVPDHRSQAVAECLQAIDQGVAPGFVDASQLRQEAGEQGGGQDGDAFLGDDAARHHREIGPVGLEQRRVDAVVLAHDNE